MALQKHIRPYLFILTKYLSKTATDIRCVKYNLSRDYFLIPFLELCELITPKLAVILQSVMTASLLTP